jgi:hypothetical protein
MREDTPGSTLRNARELRRRMTNAEEILWRVLRDRRSLGLKFRRQVPIGGITGGHAGAATGGEEQRCAEARRQSTWRLTAEEARADAVGRVEDTRFEEGETADLQAGIRARNVEEARTVSVAGVDVVHRRSLPGGKIRRLRASHGQKTRCRPEKKALYDLHDVPPVWLTRSGLVLHLGPTIRPFGLSKLPSKLDLIPSC